MLATQKVDKAERATDIRLIPVGRLSVDHAYQRNLDPRWVNYLYDHWRSNLAGIILVSQRESGETVVLDGQHRLATVRQLQADHQPAPDSLWSEVYFGLSLAEEAQIFMGRNTVRAVHPVDRFRARLVAGEPTALAIQEILLKYGGRIDYQTERGYAAVTTLEKILGWEVLDETINLLEGSWPNDNLRRMRQMLEGMGIFVLNYKDHAAFLLEAAKERFNERLNPKGLIKQVRNEALGTRINQSVLIARKLREAYRNPRAPQRLPELTAPRGYRG